MRCTIERRRSDDGWTWEDVAVPVASSPFDGIDRSTVSVMLGALGSPQPLSIDLIRAGFERMLSRRPPLPELPRLTEEAFDILWSRHASEVRTLVAGGVSGHERVRQLSLTTTMSYETAAAFVEFLDSHRARPSIDDLMRELASQRASLPSAPQGMVRPRDQRARQAPPVPPWARERGRR